MLKEQQIGETVNSSILHHTCVWHRRPCQVVYLAGGLQIALNARHIPWVCESSRSTMTLTYEWENTRGETEGRETKEKGGGLICIYAARGHSGQYNHGLRCWPHSGKGQYQKINHSSDTCTHTVGGKKEGEGGGKGELGAGLTTHKWHWVILSTCQILLSLLLTCWGISPLAEKSMEGNIGHLRERTSAYRFNFIPVGGIKIGMYCWARCPRPGEREEG